MDKQLVVLSVADAIEIVGEAVSDQLVKHGSIGKKGAASTKATVKLLLAKGIPSAALFSPYTKAKGTTLKEGAVDVVFTCKNGKHTWAALYDAVRLSVATGWCGSKKQFELYTLSANETVSKSLEITRSEMTTGIEHNQKNLRRALKRAEIKAKAENDLEIAQGIENAEKGDDAEILKLSDFMPKNSANDNKAPRDAAGEMAVSAIRRITKDIEPQYDCGGAVAAFRLALFSLNVDDPTLDPDDPKNA